MPAVDDKPSRRKIRIAHVLQNFGIGGLERVIVTLMENVDPDSFSTSVFCLEDGGELIGEMRSKGFEVTPLGKRAGVDLGIPFRLAAMLRKEKIDIVHCHNFGGMFYGATAGRMARVSRVIYTAHGPDLPGEWRQKVLQRLPLADQVVTVSDFLRDRAIKSVGIRSDKVTTVRNGIDLSLFEPRNRNEINRKKAELGIDTSWIMIGVIARLSPEKDHLTLLRAFNEVSGKLFDARLLIVGDGEQLSLLKAESTRMGLSRKVMFLGTRRDIPELLSVFDVFVLSSREEGLGITLLEAMASGVPVIATKVGGIPEIIPDREIGITLAPGDPKALSEAIEWVLKNPDNAALMANNSRDRIRRLFSMRDMVREYEDLYRTASPL